MAICAFLHWQIPEWTAREWKNPANYQTVGLRGPLDIRVELQRGTVPNERSLLGLVFTSAVTAGEQPPMPINGVVPISADSAPRDNHDQKPQVQDLKTCGRCRHWAGWGQPSDACTAIVQAIAVQMQRCNSSGIRTPLMWTKSECKDASWEIKSYAGEGSKVLCRKISISELTR